MATRTSVGTGAWSAAGTWDTGIPADGDDVVIASGHTVTFDVDQSAFVTGVKVTITGTLNHTTTTGTYVLKAKTGASIVGAGTWNIGTSGTPIPFAAKHTITGAAGWYVDGNAGLTMTVYGAEPSIKYVKLSGNEAIGQTELSVDTDVTGDIWAAGDTIRIDDINQTKETEERVIAAGGIASGAITVTAGLTAAKSTGAIVSLITRNVKFLAAGTNDQIIYRVGSTANKLTIGSGMFYGVGNKKILSTCHYAIISGGTFSNNSEGISVCNYMTVSGGTFSSNTYTFNSCLDVVVSGGLFSGNNYGLSSCNNSIVSGGLFSGNTYAITACTCTTVRGGAFSGNSAGINSSKFVFVTGGTFINNSYAIFNSDAINLSGATLTTNTADISKCNGHIYGITFTGVTEHSDYTLLTYPFVNCQSTDHDGVAGALKAWCKGGVVTSQTSVKPTGYTQAYLLDPESAIYPVFFTKTFTVSAGEIVDVEVQLRKDASMTYLPRVYLVKSIENPLAGATPTDSFTMTDSTNTWETDTFTVDNSAGTFELEYCMYFVAQNATNNAYAAYTITPRSSGTGGGAVSIQPISGRLG